jgi:hypothetical protein
MRYIWRLTTRSKHGTGGMYYSKDKSLTLRSAASWRKSGYKTQVDRLPIRTAKDQDTHCRLFGWPLILRDEGKLNNTRSFRRYQARVTRPRLYKASDVTVTIDGVVMTEFTYHDGT